mmetsp:Transcript_20056/g.30007  ORF Transcript_20056/g.30007 Transcript_20056/m.30007 type:complete len:106 (+) Transcript_20056:460-777(+)
MSTKTDRLDAPTRLVQEADLDMKERGDSSTWTSSNRGLLQGRLLRVQFPGQWRSAASFYSARSERVGEPNVKEVPSLLAQQGNLEWVQGNHLMLPLRLDRVTQRC